jgi:hypothetical protein
MKGTDPRPPTAEERKQLSDWLLTQGFNAQDAVMTVDCAYIAVYDDYVTGCPGYFGKVMSVVWDGSPGQYQAFTWEDGRIECQACELNW